MDISHIPFELPDIFEDDDSEIEEDYNPFLMNHKQEPFHSFERLFQNHFDIKDNRWVVIPRSKLNLLKSALNKLKKWHMYLKKEHEMIHSLLIQNEAMKHKIQDNEKLISSLNAGERIRSDLLHQEMHKLKADIKDRTEAQKQEMNNLIEQLQEKDRKIAKQEKSNKSLNEVSITLENHYKRVSDELSSLQKQFQYINSIKRQGIIEDKCVMGSKISTLELIMGTKVKNTLVPYLDIKDYQTVLKCSRKLYLTMIQPNSLIPHAIRTLGLKYNQQVKFLHSVGGELKSATRQTDDPQLKEIMIKQFDLNVNFTEFIVQSLRETQSLIDGDNFLNLRSNNNKELLQQLEGFLQQQSKSYKESVSSLKQEKFPWSEFFPNALLNSQQIQTQRKQFPNASQMHAQQIMSRLYDLSTICAQDASTFGMFLTQLQRSVASLFVYSTHLVSETNSLQGLNYYIMSKLFYILKEKKRYQEQVEDLETQLQLYADAKVFLNERVKYLESIQLDKDVKIQELNRQLYIKETQLNQNAIGVNRNSDLIKMYQEKLKVLAKETLDVRRRYRNVCQEYNEVVNRFQGLKNGMKQLEKY